MSLFTFLLDEVVLTSILDGKGAAAPVIAAKALLLLHDNKCSDGGLEVRPDGDRSSK